MAKKNEDIKMTLRNILCIFVFLIVLSAQYAGAFDDQGTHPLITEKASDLQFDQYLKGNLGLKSGKDTLLSYGSTKLSILKLLTTGSTAEDTPNCRAANHFHNPLLDWNQSQMSDDITPLALAIRGFCELKGWQISDRKSAVTWATGYLTKSTSSIEGAKTKYAQDAEHAPNNWDKAREYFYKALTTKSASDRDTNFAKTFQAVGQVMHLMQDMAVPAHVRNDFTSHLALNNFSWGAIIGSLNSSSALLDTVSRSFNNPFELYVKRNPDLIIGGSAPVSFSRLTDYWDKDVYTRYSASSTVPLGLAEFTNANYLSDSTIPYTFRRPSHIFPFPKIDAPNIRLCEDYAPGATDKRIYVSRRECPPITAGTADHFVSLGFWNDLSVKAITSAFVNGDPTLLAGYFSLDDNVHNTYAKELLPKAVDYSAGLLNYFFRGDINLIYDPTSSVPGFRITNNSPEQMSGMFEIYYDNTSNERVLLVRKNLLLAAANGSPVQSEIIEFNAPEPDKTKEQGKYIVVFRGKMGSEYDAVAGRVTGSGLEITPPDRYAYGVIDGSSLPQQFTEIEAKVRNAAADGRQIKAGTLWAVAKYKRRTDYQPDMSADPITSLRSVDADFSYSNSAPIAVSELSSTLPTQFTFDFSAEPIPAGITDLYLNVIFEGSIGDTPEISTAMAVKDILEPTHHVLWNLTDEVSLNGHLYTAEQILADPELLALVGGNVSLIYPRPASYAVGFSGQCPPSDFSSVSAAVSGLPAGRFIRVISLFDRQESNCLNVQWWDGASANTWSSSFRFNAAKNQTEEGVFNPAYVIPFRSILQHFYQGVLYCRPVFNGKFCAYPETEAIEPPTQIPYPLTSILP